MGMVVHRKILGAMLMLESGAQESTLRYHELNKRVTELACGCKQYMCCAPFILCFRYAVFMLVDW
jgi:hypothetical protein